LRVEEQQKNKTCKIHFIKAMSGDSFLIELGKGHCILIDCGFKSTYESELKPLLQKLHNEGCRIDLLVITHMDEDHIGGAISLIEDNGDCRNPKIIAIDNIWFNGIFDLCCNNDFLSSHLVEKLSETNYKKIARLRGIFLRLIGTGDGFVSAKHAEAFEVLCRDYNYVVNAEAKNGLIMAGDKINIGEWKISVLSPGEREVDCFAKWIDGNLISALGRDYKLDQNDFIGFIEKMIIAMAEDEDGSCGRECISAGKTDIENWIGTSTLARMNEANRMSIVMEIECNEISMLFTGDSESGDWIERAKPQYDVVKLSHHGTTKPNIALLQNINAEKILISTNGKKNHPENDILARIFYKGIRDVYFNYKIRQKEQILGYQSEYGYTAHFEENVIKIEG
jgi:hypothetical protein